MTEVIKLVQGDSRPSLIVTITDKKTGTPLNLTGTSLVLKFREQGATELTGIVPGTVVDPTDGVCVFHWSSVSGILDGEAGNYEGEVEIIYDDATNQTVYEQLYFYLREQY